MTDFLTALLSPQTDGHLVDTIAGEAAQINLSPPDYAGFSWIPGEKRFDIDKVGLSQNPTGLVVAIMTSF